MVGFRGVRREGAGEGGVRCLCFVGDYGEEKELVIVRVIFG